MDFSGVLRRIVLSLSACMLLLSPTTTLSQEIGEGIDIFSSGPNDFKVDSFFDIDFDLGDLDDLCDPCDAIESEIAQKQEMIDGLKEDLDDLEQWLDDLATEIGETEDALLDAEAELEEFLDPQNFVESEGRRYDSSDHAAMRTRSANLWRSYRDGNISAQEYSDEVGKDFDDPDIQRELDKIKKDIERNLEDNIDDLQDQLDTLKEKQKEWNELGAELTADLEKCLNELEELLKALEDCRKQCKQGPVDVEGLGVVPEQRNILDSLSDFFGNLFNPPSVIPGLDDALDAMNGSVPEIPTELVQMDLTGKESIQVDSFFDVFVDVELVPPICHLCYPIWQQILEFEATLGTMLWQREWADQLVEATYDDLGDMRDAKNSLEEDLNALNNPSDYVESEGRRYDSTDRAAMQQRNARLWGDYRSGRLSAGQLSNEWAKPFDHPDVQRELDRIKDGMKGELEEAIDEAQETIDELNETIEDLNDILVDLAGSIAAHEIIIGHLYEQLADCENRCTEPEEDNSLIIDLDGFLKSLNKAIIEFEQRIERGPDACSEFLGNEFYENKDGCERDCQGRGKECAIAHEEEGLTCYYCREREKESACKDHDLLDDWGCESCDDNPDTECRVNEDLMNEEGIACYTCERASDACSEFLGDEFYNGKDQCEKVCKGRGKECALAHEEEGLACYYCREREKESACKDHDLLDDWGCESCDDNPDTECRVNEDLMNEEGIACYTCERRTDACSEFLGDEFYDSKAWCERAGCKGRGKECVIAHEEEGLTCYYCHEREKESACKDHDLLDEWGCESCDDNPDTECRLNDDLAGEEGIACYTCERRTDACSEFLGDEFYDSKAWCERAGCKGPDKECVIGFAEEGLACYYCHEREQESGCKDHDMFDERDCKTCDDNPDTECRMNEDLLNEEGIACYTCERRSDACSDFLGDEFYDSKAWCERAGCKGPDKECVIGFAEEGLACYYCHEREKESGCKDHDLLDESGCESCEDNPNTQCYINEDVLNEEGILCYSCDPIEGEEDEDEDDKDEDDEDRDEDEDDGIEGAIKTNWFCRTLGWFCPPEPLPTLGAFADCIVERSADPFCTDNFDLNGDGQTNTVDIELVALSLRSVEPITVGGQLWDVQIDLSGMDGTPGLSPQDLRLGSDCFSDGLCDGLDVTLPPDLSEIPIDLAGNDFRPLLTGGGNDVLLGDPLSDDFVGVRGVDAVDFADNPIPGGFFGPGSDPFDGTVNLQGGNDGIDLLYFGTTDNTAGLEWPANDPPPPPRVPPPSQAQPEQVPQAVKDVIARIIRDNPLEPCEKLIINVRRIRVGNRVSYTITVTRTRDQEACPPAQCPPNTSYESIGPPSPADCAAACQNGAGGCSVLETLADGRTCILCGPPTDVSLCGNGELESGEACETDSDCPYNNYCSECICQEQSVDDGDLCEDVNCDDGDECTSDECEPEGGLCINTPIDGCGETDEPPTPNCSETLTTPYQNQAQCEPNCESSTHECQGWEMPGGGSCWGCVDRDLDQLTCRRAGESNSRAEAQDECKSNEEPWLNSQTRCWECRPVPAQECDSLTLTESGCRNSCDGTCTKSYTRKDGVKCFECILPDVTEDDEQCSSGSVGSCGDCPSNTTCNALSDFCFTCDPIVDDGPTCSSGTTANESDCESQCPSDGVCVGEDGCYSCIVVNCPSGTTRNECPSSCSNGCDVVGEQLGVKCYQCKQDCETVCAENDYGPESTDHSNSILSELEGYSCVSGASISIQTATIGECSCVGDYSLTVDTTPPVCAGTPCGDVECNGSASCPGGPNETITVNCNWGGWEQIEKHQFRPVVGN